MCCRNKINASEANFIHSMIDQYSLRNEILFYFKCYIRIDTYLQLPKYAS